MAEQEIHPDLNQGSTEEVNPYFAIEKDIYGEENRKRRARRKRTWIKLGILSSITFAMLTLVIYDVCINIIGEANLPKGTLVAGMTYKQLRESINKSTDGSGKIWVDFNNPYEATNEDNLALTLKDQKLVVTSSNEENLNYILVNPASQAIYKKDYVFDNNTFDFSTHSLNDGDYILCAFKDPYSIPYRPVVDNHFHSRLGSSNFRRASKEDQSIQEDGKISLIQDPTLLCLSVIRIG